MIYTWKCREKHSSRPAQHPQVALQGCCSGRLLFSAIFCIVREGPRKVWRLSTHFNEIPSTFFCMKARLWTAHLGTIHTLAHDRLGFTSYASPSCSNGSAATLASCSSFNTVRTLQPQASALAAPLPDIHMAGSLTSFRSLLKIHLCPPSLGPLDKHLISPSLFFLPLSSAVTII